MKIVKQFLFIASIAISGFSQAQTPTPLPACDPQIKETIARRLNAITAFSYQEQLRIQQQIYDTYFYCAADGASVPTTDPIYTAASQCGAKISFLGSTYFEELSCCGYDPQRRQFACPIRIKQAFGFGGSPLPGSREHVLHCIRNVVNQWVPVSFDSVHLSNSAFAPSWQFGTVSDVNTFLHLVQPMNGVVRQARTILSWGLLPTGCQYQPIWGNSIDYQIRLDQ